MNVECSVIVSLALKAVKKLRVELQTIRRKLIPQILVSGERVFLSWWDDSQRRSIGRLCWSTQSWHGTDNTTRRDRDFDILRRARNQLGIQARDMDALGFVLVGCRDDLNIVSLVIRKRGKKHSTNLNDLIARKF
jgi:hypothetical protein